MLPDPVLISYHPIVVYRYFFSQFTHYTVAFFTKVFGYTCLCFIFYYITIKKMKSALKILNNLIKENIFSLKVSSRQGVTR